MARLLLNRVLAAARTPFAGPPCPLRLRSDITVKRNATHRPSVSEVALFVGGWDTNVPVARVVAAFTLAGVLCLGLPAMSLAAYSIGNYMYPVNDFPQGIHAGDCNGDGLPDVVIADQLTNDITILRNFGGGHFAFFTSISGAGSPRGAVCADFTNDGLADVAAIDRDAGNAIVYQQKPTGGYQKLITIAVGKQPNSISAADLDHDGNMDLVVISTSSGIMTIRFGDGNGGFPRSTTISLPMATPLYAAIGDFNLDNNLDIAVGGGGIGTRKLVFYMGDGHGIFTASPVTLPSLPIPRALAAADLDADGISDLAILSNDGTVNIFLGSVSGEFTLAKTFVLPVRAQSIDFADFDGDGIQDLAVGSNEINSVMILRGLGDLNFAPVSSFDDIALDTVVEAPGNGTPRSVTVPNDLPLETVVDDVPTTDLVRVNDATKSLESVDIGLDSTVQTTTLAQIPDPPSTVLLADMNNDGTPDAIVTTKTRHGIGLQVLLGNANEGYDPLAPGIGTCGNGVVEPGEVCDTGGASLCRGCVPQIGTSLLSIAAADIDGDGNQDLIVVGAPGRLLLLLGNGKGQFSNVRLVAKTQAKIPAVVGDFNLDGTMDIVAVLHQKGASGLTLLSNDGTGAFTTTPIPLPVGSVAKGPVLAADFDRNGALDLALGTSQRGAGSITVLLNDGNGAMPTSRTISVSRGLKTLSAADFNEDGWLDVLGSFDSGTHSTMMLYAGNADGDFSAGTPAIDSTGTSKGAAASIVDLNDDTHQDVVVCRSSPATNCQAHFGTGTGSFIDAPPTNDNYIGRQLRAIAVKDLDGDGVLDFIGVARRDNRVVVLFRDASFAVTTRLILPTGGIKPRALAIGDVDGDSRPDIVVANETTADLTVFLNRGNRVFDTIGPVSLKPVGLVPTGIGLVDLDGDQKPDVVVSFQGTSNVGFFLIKDLAHLNGGGFVSIGSMSTGAQPVELILADLNGDQIPDIVTVNNKGVPPPAAATPTPAATPTATDGAGTPGPTRTPTPVPTQSPGATGSLTLLLSTAVGSYSRTDMDPGGTNTWGIHAEDVNHDDALDLLVVNSEASTQPGTLVTFLNDGFGNFAKASTQRRGRKNSRELCTGDFNGDGDMDVAVTSMITKDVMVLFGNGDGTWKRGERVYAVGKLPRSIACEDIDGDGLTDVIFGRLNRGDIDIIRTGK